MPQLAAAFAQRERRSVPSQVARDRELACDGFGRTALSLRNGTEPAITVTVPSDYDGATVVIQEN